jgi:hypothetical protein
LAAVYVAAFCEYEAVKLALFSVDGSGDFTFLNFFFS